MSFRCVRRSVLLAALILALGPALTAAPVSEAAKAATPVERLRKSLDQTLSVNIQDQPLALAVNMLREKSGVNLVLDQGGIQQMLAATGPGVDLSQLAVSHNFKDVKLRTALRTLLTPFNLSFGIVGDTVLISHEDLIAQRQLRQRVNVELDKSDLTAALKKLSRETGTNLIVDKRAAKEAQTPISLELEDVPLETAVRLMCEMVGLKAVRVGNVLFVSTKEHAAEMKNDPDFAPTNPGAVPGVNVPMPPGGPGLPPGVGPGGVVPGAPGGVGNGVPPMVVPAPAQAEEIPAPRNR
jgi:hypothetical protein